MILKYLIPVKLSIGILPKKSLLEKYKIVEITTGYLFVYENDQILKIWCVSCLGEVGAPSLSEISKEDLYDSKAKGSKPSHLVKLDVIVEALKGLKMDIDVVEVQCMLAILIHKKLMKGYFAHKSKVLVLSKQDPFPKPSGEPVNL
ncbi:hypothetical protein ACLOJK_028514 [Asimina triloba]